MDNTLEKSLIERIHQGDRMAFGELYDAWFPKIYAFIYYRTHHRETSQDIAATVFLKALEAIDRFDPEKGTVGAWLYRIARNAVTDHWRRQKPTLDVADAWDLTDGTDVALDADFRLRVEQVRAGLAHLTAEQRDVVIMRVWENLPYAEIAAALGKTEDGCKMAFSRAVRKLRATVPLAALLALIIRI